MGQADRREQRRDPQPLAVDRQQRRRRFRRASATKSFPGTTLVQLSGSLKTPGIVEVPLGMSIRRMLELAGGPTDDAPLKAVLVGVRRAASCRSPNSTPCIRRPRWPAGAHSGDRAPSWPSISEPAWSTWPPLCCATCPTSRVARQSPAASACAGMYEIGRRATNGLTRPVDAQVFGQLAADVQRRRAVRAGEAGSQSIPVRDEILRGRVRPAFRARHTVPPACAKRCPRQPRR